MFTKNTQNTVEHGSTRILNWTHNKHTNLFYLSLICNKLWCHYMFLKLFPSHSCLQNISTSQCLPWLQIMDERWESEIIEYGAINITGFRILDTHKRHVKEFLESWRKLDAATSPGAGKEQISVGWRNEKIRNDNDRSHNNKWNAIWVRNTQ